MVSIVCLLLSYLSPFVNPKNFWLISFFGLAYPVLLVVNGLFVIFWGLQWKRKALFSLIVILAGWLNIGKTAQVNINNSAPGNTDSTTIFKVMSYNVRLFNLYNWTNNKETTNKIFDLLQEESPDIICFQEFYHSDKKDYFATIDSLKKILKAKNYHVEYTIVKRGTGHWGMATFSSYPIIKKEKISFGGKFNNICIYSDIKIGNDTIRVYNLHLSSIGLSPEDYELINDISDYKDSNEIKRTTGVLRRLKRAFVKRAKQTNLITENLKNCPYPIVVCGDFNDTPVSYSYKKIADNLNDAFIESGNGFGKTYIGKLPSFRIDYILHSKDLKSYEFLTLPDTLSDHYPVTCFLEIPVRN